MSNDPALKFVGAHPPAFTEEQAQSLSEEYFGISGTANPLWGERDQNFKIIHDSHSGYVLKISNDREDARAIDFQIGALRHLATNAPSVAVPQVVPLLSGDLYGTVEGPNGVTHRIHLVTLLDGVTLDDAGPSTVNLRAAGFQAGIATVGLRGFFHAAAGDDMFWDIRHLGKYATYVPEISDDAIRRRVQDIMSTFCDDVLPGLAGLRSQIIHYDTNRGNVLVDPDNPGTVTGLIDFGDMIHGSIAQDAAVAAAELVRSDANMLDDLVAVVSGYDRACPLEDAEINLIYDLVAARYALGVLIGVTRTLHGIHSVDNIDYLELFGPPLDSLLNLGRDTVRKALRSACRFPEYCPPVPLPAGTNHSMTRDLASRRRGVLGEELPLSYDVPLHTVRGEGVWLFDVDGRRYLDCYNNVPHVGHCHPHVVRALARQATALNTNSRYLYESIIEYAERIGELMPGDLGACLFVNSGSEANDIALRMAKECSGQDGALIVDGAYHGITNEIYALSPAAEWGMHAGGTNAHVSEHRADIEMVESPDTVRGRFNAEDAEAGAKYAADADRAIATLDKAGHPVGAFMVDSAFSTNGILDVPTGYVSGISDRVRASGGMIIADEVQYGFGRSGENLWGFQNHEIQPDFVTLGKPIGNGIAIGVVVTTPQILERFTRTKEFFSTFGGNPVACNAALAVLDVIEQEGLMENARDTGQYLREGLRSVSAGNARIGDVRGKGLFIGVDIVTDPDTMTPDQVEASRIKNYLRNSGCLVGTDGIGGNILKIRPPLVFRRDHADMLIETFAAAL